MTRKGMAITGIALCALGGGLILMLAGAMKFAAPQLFALALRDHGLVPEAMIGIATWVVPGLEFSLGAIVVYLSVRGRPGAAMFICGSVFGVFCLYALALTVSPPPKPSGCGCGIVSGLVKDWAGVALRNGLIACALILVAAGVSRMTVERTAASGKDALASR